MLPRSRRLENWLARASSRWFGAYCILAAFGTYFCMYAFRKPFTAATFEGDAFGDIALKTLFVAAQVAGYTASKFLGIRVVSEMTASRRALTILLLIGSAELALLLFAITPAPWNAIWLFANGLPLGMVFGLVIAFLEGRRQTEALTAGLCASFILSSGVVKSVGQSLIVEFEVNEYWMPVTTGLLFLPFLVLFVVLLAHITPPGEADRAHRSERTPMSREHRREFFRRRALGLIGLVVTYLLLTVGRSMRDDYAVEIWRDLGTDGKPQVFAQVELLVMFGVLLVNALSIRIRSNRSAFLGSLGISIGGFAILVTSVLLQQSGSIGPFTFMTLSGLGLYIPYVAFHTTVFERLIAAYRERANIGYLMYLADAFGYLGYVGIMVARNFTTRTENFLDLYAVVAITVAGLATVSTLVVARYFSKRLPSEPETPRNDCGRSRRDPRPAVRTR